MNKAEILAKFDESLKSYLDYIEYLTKDEFEYAPDGKWNAGEQTVHVIKSQNAINSGLKLPKFILKNRIGMANRPSRTYEELVARYQERVAATQIKAPKPFRPNKTYHSDLLKLKQDLEKARIKFEKALNKWSEERLDAHALPHPLMGKVTVREILYFAIYHMDHHHNLIKRYLKGI